MSEQKKTIEELQSEYTKLCQKGGHLQYQIHALTSELSTLNDTLRSINLEAAAISAEQKASAEASAKIADQAGA